MNSNSTETKDIKKFGIIALVFFGVLCALGILTKKPVPTYLFGTLAFAGLCFILAPSKMKPVYSGWLKIAHFIGVVITAFILILTYYLVITPSALLKRLIGGAPIPVRPDKKASSYWVTRPEPAQPKERFLKRF